MLLHWDWEYGAFQQANFIFGCHRDVTWCVPRVGSRMPAKVCQKLSAAKSDELAPRVGPTITGQMPAQVKAMLDALRIFQ